MSGTRVAFALLFVLGCVPATSPREPRGAAGVVTRPTAATRGAAFVTSDGWTVRIEALYLRAVVSASSTLTEEFGSSEEYVWNAAEEHTLYARAVREGAAEVQVHLQPGFTGRRAEDEATNLGVSAEVGARFSAPDEAPAIGDGSGTPAVVVRAVGEKDGRRVRIDVGYSTTSIESPVFRVEVVRDDVRATPMDVRGEELFAFSDDGLSRFEPLADADTSGDGLADASELRAARAPCPAELDAEDLTCRRSLLDLLRLRSSSVLGPVR